MKERIAVVIVLFLLIVGIQGQPLNEHKYTSLRELLLSQDELTNLQEVLSDEDELTNIQRLEALIQRSNQLLETFCRFLLKTELLSRNLHHCINLRTYMRNENYILQSIILKMKKYYKIEGYALLDKYLKLRGKELEYLSTEDLEGLDGRRLEDRVRNKIYLLSHCIQEDKAEMAASEKEIDDFLIRIATESRHYYEKELLLLNNIKSFVEETNKQPSKHLPNEEDFINIVYVIWSIFWMSMHFRVCSIYSNVSDNFDHKDMCESYFEAMMLAFNSFKGEIYDFYQKTFSNIPPSTPTNETDITFVIHELLKLSLDFVLNEDTLMKKEPDEYESGIIKYNEIERTKLGKVEYKTIFPFDLTIEEFSEMKQLDEDPIMIEDIYYAFNQKISKVIDGNKAEKIEHFFMKKIFGNEENLIHTKEIIWFNPFYFETEVWETLEEQNAKIDIHEPAWKVKVNVISLIEWFKQRDRYLLFRYISIWRSHTNEIENLFYS